jgi:hypothetical protein
LWLPIGLFKILNESPLGLILKKSCMSKTQSTSDLEATHSYAKNTIGTKRTKWLPLAHIFKFIFKNLVGPLARIPSIN